jgi:hypothetical protein
MPRPGFYNDNEYRAYPFVFRTSYPGPALPDAAIVDAGLIMGLDSGYNPAEHSVWLSSISRAGGVLTFTFASDAPGAATQNLSFVCSTAAEEWLSVFGESGVIAGVPSACDPAPIWEGFLVVGALATLLEQIADNSTVTYPSQARVLEPGRVQSLLKGYLRSVNVGNFTRVRALPAPECDDSSTAVDENEVVVNATCMQGNIRVKEGYHCRIRQIERTNEINISADRTAGDTEFSPLCEHGGDLPLYDDEPFDAATGFYGGGPACNQVISAINGIGGPNVSLIAGTGVTITTNPTDKTITIALAQNNLVGGCGTEAGT